jgi:hypothetical protein
LGLLAHRPICYRFAIYAHAPLTSIDNRAVCPCHSACGSRSKSGFSGCYMVGHTARCVSQKGFRFMRKYELHGKLSTPVGHR